MTITKRQGYFLLTEENDNAVT